jgi:hypothetical protein
MKINILLTLVSLGASLVSGCSSEALTANDRKQNVLQQLRVTDAKMPPGETNATQVDGVLLKALDAATVDSLRQPVIASSELWELLHVPTGSASDPKFGPCRLFVHWLEDQPTPDAVEIKYRTNSPTILPIDGLELNGERMAAKHSVLFGAHYSWASIVDFEAAFGPVAGTNDLQVRLRRDSQPVTDWSSVYCYTLDVGR